MLTVREYQELLEKRKELSDYFNQEFEDLAENSAFRRNRCTKKSKKLLEKELYFAIGKVWENEVKTYNKGEHIDMDMEVVKVKKENKLIGFFKKLFNKKPKNQVIGIERTENLIEEPQRHTEEIESTPIRVETTDKIPGQMDIQDLEEK